MAPGAEQGIRVRADLLRAALDLIPERGWGGVSTRILAERAGVSASVVHYHFASLPALLNEAVISAMHQLFAGVEPVVEGAASPEELVEVLIGSVDQYSGTDSLSTVFVEAYLASVRDERLQSALAEVLTALRGRLADRLMQFGVEDPVGTAAVLAAAVDGILLHRGLGVGPSGAQSAQVLQRLVR